VQYLTLANDTEQRFIKERKEMSKVAESGFRAKAAFQKSKIMDADTAVRAIQSGSTVAFCGAGGGMTEPTLIINALAKRFKEDSLPRDLTLLHTSGLGNRNDLGMSPLALDGLSRRIIGGHWGQSPRLAEMAERNEIEAYNFPQGIMAQLFRCAAAHQPGLITNIGLGTFLDPRQQGGRLNDRTTEDLVRLMEVDGKEWLFYPALAPDVAVIRGTTADTDGYISMEDEISYLDCLQMAQAAHNNNGLVIAQVHRLVKPGTLHPKSIRIPGFMVDVIVVDPDQKQLYTTGLDRYISGDFVKETLEREFLALNERKVVARRALMELKPGDVGNVGVGIPDGIGLVAQEEGLADSFTLTVEHGTCGGTSLQGIFFGASINMRAMLDMPAQFDFYHGGGLDVAFLSFAEVDQAGDVNVHKFNGKIMGTGGFVDICQNTRKIIFMGTLTSGGLKVEIGDGRLEVVNDGRFQKFVPFLDEITFNAGNAFSQGQEILYVTERAVFKLAATGVELTEIAPGIDLERDLVSRMGFRPEVSPNLKLMDSRLFRDEPMGIDTEWLGRVG